ncbi:MAG: PQQ-binding-like beta-propeller repeat protein [Planctomycetes bacterium]|nr:PQQ-binding-like beta-propeller repeat protein [Planctomycetota bacterium]
MAFKGDVGQLSLLNIYQALNLNRQSGILVISSGKVKRKVRFLPNGIRLLTNYPGDYKGLKQILAKLKILTESQFQNVISTKNDDKMPLGDFLFHRRIIDQDLIEGPISKHILELIYETFSWKSAKYEFHAGGDTDDLELFSLDGPGKSLTFKVPNVLMEVARREDEWNRILAEIPSEKEIFVPVNRGEFLKRKEYDAEAPTESILEIKQLIDGERSIESICQETTLSNYETYIVLKLLMAEGEIRAFTIEEKKELAEKLRKKGKLRELIDVYNYLLTLEPDDLQTRLSLVSLLEKKKDFCSFLVEHYQYLAEHSIASGELSQAKNYLARMLEIEPTSPAAQEWLFEVHCNLGENREALEAGRQIVESAKQAKEYSRGTSILERMIKVFPEDPSLYHEAADLYQLNGNTAEAVRCLKAAASIYESRRDLTRLRKTYERIAGLDSSEGSTLRKILDLEKKKNKRGLNTFSVAFAGLAAALIAFTVYWITMEVFCRRAFAAVDRDVQTLAENGRFKDAQMILNSLVRDFPLSAKRWEISNRLNSIATDQWKMVSKIRQDAEKENLLFGSFLAQVEKLRRERKYVEALNQIQGIRRVGLSPANLNILKKIETEIIAIFNEAQATLKKAQALTQSGKLQEAHPLYIQLLMEYSSTPVAQNLKIPMQLKTVPAGAEVFVNEQMVGKSPLTFYYHPFEKFRLKIVKEGFQEFLCGDPATEQPCFDFTKDWTLSAYLKRLPAWTVSALDPLGGAYLFDGKNLYYSTQNGKVLGHRIDSRETAWTYTTPKNLPIKSELRLWKNLIYFGAMDGLFIAIDKDSGQSRLELVPLKNSHPYRLVPSPASENGTVAVVAKPYVLGLNLQSGTLVWTYPCDNLVEAPPQPLKGSIVCVTTAGEILFLDEGLGSLKQAIDLKTALTSAGVEYGGAYFITDSQGTIYRIQLSTAEIQWSFRSEITGLSPPSVKNDQVIVSSSHGNILALDINKGSRKWDVKVQDSFPAPGIIANNQYYIGSQKGVLFCFDMQTGHYYWTFQADGPFIAPPRLESGLVIIGSEKNTLYSFREK